MSENDRIARRARPSGREARQKARAARPVAPAYITREIPPYEFLSPDGLNAVERHADLLLEEIGLEIRGDDEAIRLWREAGATVTDGCRIHVPAGLARDIVRRSAPRVFTQHARNPARNVQIGGNHTVFAPAYGPPFVSDLDRGRRYGTLEDFQNFVKLSFVSPWLHHSGGTVCEPVDVPVNKRHFDMVYAHMRYSDKPFMGSVTSAARAADSIELCRILFGADFVANNCVILGNVNVNSPLVLDGEASRVIRTYAAANQAPVCVPLILGNFLSSMSLRSGAPTFGTPEPALAYFAIGQLARRLGVPLRCGGNLCASKVADSQAASESANSLWPAFLGGANFMLHSAGWLEAGLVMSYEKFVMDVDQLGGFHTLAKGMPLDDNGFALEAFREIGPGSHYLGSAHTMANYERAFHDFELADNNSYEQWRAEGGRDQLTRANQRWKSLLQSYEAPSMDAAIDEALKDYIGRRKAAMPNEIG